MSTAEIAQPNAAKASFSTDVSGVYGVELLVSDGDLESDPVEATLRSDNRPPVANAGSEIRADLGAEVPLDGTASSDPDSDPLSYRWTMVRAPSNSTRMLLNATSSRARVFADVEGVFELELRVDDGEAQSDAARVRVGVGVSVNPPIADAGMPRSVTIGDEVTLSGQQSSDPDGDSLRYEWRITSRPPGGTAELANANGVATKFTPNALGVWTIELTVDDGFYRATASVAVTAVTDRVFPGRSTFDPSRTYFVGTLLGGGGSIRVLCDPGAPNDPSAGFSGQVMNGVIDPSNGSFVYVHQALETLAMTVRRFRPEALLWDAAAQQWLYPTSAADNDPIVPTPECPEDVHSVQVKPATGELVYFCETPRSGFDLQGNALPVCEGSSFPLSLGYDGSFLCISTVHDANGVSHPHAGRNHPVMRARPQGGYWNARFDSASKLFQRVVIHADGTEVVDLTYPPMPSDVREQLQGSILGGDFDGSGNLYHSAARGSDDLVLLFRADLQPTEVVFDEGAHPACQKDLSIFVTGP